MLLSLKNVLPNVSRNVPSTSGWPAKFVLPSILAAARRSNSSTETCLSRELASGEAWGREAWEAWGQTWEAWREAWGQTYFQGGLGSDLFSSFENLKREAWGQTYFQVLKT